MRPIGSEKISNVDDKLKRILEIAGISKKHDFTEIPVRGSLSNVLHEAVSADGREYGIIQEEKHVYIKEKIDGNYEYMSGVQNIHEYSYRSYAEALKHLNLIFKQINEDAGQIFGVDISKKKA